MDNKLFANIGLLKYSLCCLFIQPEDHACYLFPFFSQYFHCSFLDCVCHKVCSRRQQSDVMYLHPVVSSTNQRECTKGQSQLSSSVQDDTVPETMGVLAFCLMHNH